VLLASRGQVSERGGKVLFERGGKVLFERGGKVLFERGGKVLFQPYGRIMQYMSMSILLLYSGSLRVRIMT